MRWVKRVILGLAVLFILGLTFQKWSEFRDTKRVIPPGKLISVGDHKLHLWCIGQSGPTVLMLSGGGTPSVTLYDAQMRIAKFTRVCSYDRTGLGWSDPATKPMALADHVSDLEVLLAKGGVQGPLILAPESMGGLIALAYTRRNPDRVAGAVFIDASETQLYFEAVPATVPQFKLKEWLWEIGWRTGIVRLALPYAKPDFVDRLSPEIQAQFYAIWSRPNHGYFRDFIDIVENTPASDQAVTAAGSWDDKPVVALRHGKIDGSVLPATEPGWPEAQARLAALSKRGKVVIATGVGHMIAEDAPQLVADTVESVARRLRVDN